MRKGLAFQNSSRYPQLTVCAIHSERFNKASTGSARHVIGGQNPHNPSPTPAKHFRAVGAQTRRILSQPSKPSKHMETKELPCEELEGDFITSAYEARIRPLPSQPHKEEGTAEGTRNSQFIRNINGQRLSIHNQHRQALGRHKANHS